METSSSSGSDTDGTCAFGARVSGGGKGRRVDADGWLGYGRGFDLVLITLLVGAVVACGWDYRSFGFLPRFGGGGSNPFAVAAAAPTTEELSRDV